MSSLPPEILELVEFSPLEDMALYLLRDGFGDTIRVQSLLEDDQTFPAVLVRRAPTFGVWFGDERFIDTGQLSVQVYCEGINADSDAALLSEACRVVLRDSRNKEVPGRGYLTRADLQQSPRRVADFATATGPVQYADLPTGVVRYESVYDLSLRIRRDGL